MTLFQIVAAAAFVLCLVATYKTSLLSLFKKTTTTGGLDVKQSIAVPLVNDILAVTQLRDRLSAEGCQNGVDACTSLLRVIVEYDQPSKGTV